ncbi:MAG: SH3 domain-containing protein [Burkholderiales bacterium]
MRRLTVLVCASALLAGCATAPAPEPAPAPVPAVPPPPPPPPCPVCVDRSDEVARLRQELAARESELRDLRASQREQAKTVQETTREVTRAKARARRLATQADAASYIAEVEVALGSARGSAASGSPLLPLAQSFIDGASLPFAQGDYASAMERAAQAEQLVAAALDAASIPARARVAGEVRMVPGIPLRAGAAASLRREPQAKAPVVAAIGKDTALVAHGYKAAWMRVETEDGRAGWIPQRELAPR